MHSYLIQRGYKPKHQVLDNEASPALQAYLNTNLDSFQFVPPYLHRKNAAERAICAFKNHFITILCSVHQNFPLYLWCKLLSQTKMSLNMVYPCRTNPKLSAHASLESEYSHNYAPIAPLGAQIIVCDSHAVRSTWSSHVHYAWLIGPATDHYR